MKTTVLLAVIVGMAAFASDAFSAPGAGNPDRGEELYRANCYVCHGVDPAHEGPLGPVIQGSSRELLKIRLEKGGRHYPKGYKPKRETTVMPAQAHLLGNLDDLLAYLNMDHARKPAAAAAGGTKVGQGQGLFAATCAPCHNSEGQGRVGLAPSVTDRDFLALVPDSFLKTTITKGRPGTNMIAFSFLGNDKIDAIVAYLRSFQQGPARKYDAKWKARGNLANGKRVYETTCGQCHGVTGKGFLLGGSGTAIGLNGFLGVAGDGYIKQVLLSGREGTPMRAFGGPSGLAQLSDKDMTDVIVYLRALGKKNAGGR